MGTFCVPLLLPQVRGHPTGRATERQGEDQVKSHPQRRAGEVLCRHHQTPQAGEGTGRRGVVPKRGSPWPRGGDVPAVPRPTWRCSPRRAAARCGRWSAGFAAAATRTGPACSRSSGRPGETPRPASPSPCDGWDWRRGGGRHPHSAGNRPGKGGNMGLVGPSFSLPHPGAPLRTVCFLFPVGDSRFTLLLSLLAWLS